MRMHAQWPKPWPKPFFLASRRDYQEISWRLQYSLGPYLDPYRYDSWL